MKIKQTQITKAQAAALLRGKILPYRGYSTKLANGDSVGHKPDGTFVLNKTNQTPPNLCE